MSGLPNLSPTRYSVHTFNGDGSTVQWSINFAGGYISKSHVKAVVFDSAGTPSYPAFTWSGNSTIVISPAVPVGSKLIIYRDTPKGAPLADFTEGAVVNEVNLDTIAMQSVFIAAEAMDRGEGAISELAPRVLQVPDGETVKSVPKQTDRAGKFLVFDALGNPQASNGTGVDSALRTDLSASTGASLIGTYGGSSVQNDLDLLLNTLVMEALAHPPGSLPDQDWRYAIPTTISPVMVGRMTPTKLLVRVLLANGAIEQTILRDPDGESGVAGGWQTWCEQTIYKGRVYDWLIQPDIAGQITNTDFAWRILPYANPYSSGNETANGSYAGFGHGRMTNVPANNQVILVGAPDGNMALNLQSITNFPVGTVRFGTSLAINSSFKLKYYDNTTEAVQIQYYQTFIPDTGNGGQGYVQQGVITPLIAGVGYNDCYCNMFAVTGARRGIGVAANKFEVVGSSPQVDLVGELVAAQQQKGNWNTTTGTEFRAWHTRNPSVRRRSRLAYGQPIRKQGGGLAPWGLNKFGRVHVTDAPDVAKLRVFAASSEEGLPRTAWEHPLGTVYEWQNYRDTVIL